MREKKYFVRRRCETCDCYLSCSAGVDSSKANWILNIRYFKQNKSRFIWSKFIHSSGNLLLCIRNKNHRLKISSPEPVFPRSVAILGTRLPASLFWLTDCFSSRRTLSVENVTESRELSHSELAERIEEVMLPFIWTICVSPALFPLLVKPTGP